MLPFVLALLASVSWGVGDFLGGLKSRSLPLLVVLAASQPVGLLTIALVVLIRRAPMPELSFLPYAIAGGIAVTIGIAAFFRALAVGTMSVVAPISAVGTAVPIIFGLLAGERPGIGQILGIALTTIGVVLVAREPAKPGEAARPMGPGVALAVVAALSFGCFLTAMHEASGEDAYWATLVQRLTTMVNEVLDFTRQTPGTVALEPMWFSDFVSVFIEEVGPLAGDRVVGRRVADEDVRCGDGCDAREGDGADHDAAPLPAGPFDERRGHFGLGNRPRTEARFRCRSRWCRRCRNYSTRTSRYNSSTNWYCYSS